MRVIFDGNLYKIVRITGPTHNYLGLELDVDHGNGIVTEALTLSESETPVVTADIVRRQVTRALAEFNSCHETAYSIKRAQFVASDTPHPSDVYYRLTLEVLEYVHVGSGLSNVPIIDEHPDPRVRSDNLEPDDE